MIQPQLRSFRITVQLLALSSIFTVLSATAGEKAGNGQTGVACQGKELVTLDYYQAMLPHLNGTKKSIIDVKTLGYAGTTKFITDKLSRTEFAGAYFDARRRLGPMNKWIATDLSRSGDTGQPYPLPATCTEVQLASQSAHTVFVDPAYVPTLNDGQKALVEAHEILYNYAIQRKGATDSAKVRELMTELLTTGTGEASAVSLERALSRFVGTAVKLGKTPSKDPLWATRNGLLIRWTIVPNEETNTDSRGALSYRIKDDAGKVIASEKEILVPFLDTTEQTNGTYSVDVWYPLPGKGKYDVDLDFSSTYDDKVTFSGADITATGNVVILNTKKACTPDAGRADDCIKVEYEIL